jgi:hypothetical protein
MRDKMLLEEVNDAPALAAEQEPCGDIRVAAPIATARRLALEALEREFRDLLVPQL